MFICEILSWHPSSISPQDTDAFSPRYLEGPLAGTYLLGGICGLIRPLDIYLQCVKEVRAFKQEDDQDRGRMLCLALLRREFTEDELQTQNVTGVARNLHNRKRVHLGKLNQIKLEAIFSQAAMQFPDFVDEHTKKRCKTVVAIQDVCKQCRKKAQAKDLDT